jgi:outer membrane protein OmpA-like peptidoglycan-associated protein
MSGARSSALLLTILAGALAAACAPVRLQVPERPGQTLVVLLPDGDGDTAGRATVSNRAGASDLASPHDATVVFANRAPSPAAPLNESEARRLFADVLSALPPPPQNFTLYFRFDSNELTEESRSKVPEIRDAIRNHPVPELLIIGYTDTAGSKASNFDLGLQRADVARLYLIANGVDPSTIKITSHGELDLLIPTADGVLEPRNRRVDISVR